MAPLRPPRSGMWHGDTQPCPAEWNTSDMEKHHVRIRRRLGIIKQPDDGSPLLSLVLDVGCGANIPVVFMKVFAFNIGSAIADGLCKDFENEFCDALNTLSQISAIAVLPGSFGHIPPHCVSWAFSKTNTVDVYRILRSAHTRGVTNTTNAWLASATLFVSTSDLT